MRNPATAERQEPAGIEGLGSLKASANVKARHTSRAEGSTVIADLVSSQLGRLSAIFGCHSSVMPVAGCCDERRWKRNKPLSSLNVMTAAVTFGKINPRRNDSRTGTKTECKGPVIKKDVTAHPYCPKFTHL